MTSNKVTLPVKKEDIVSYSRFEVLLDALSAGGLGLFGFLVFSVGTGLFDMVFRLSPLVFLWVWATVGFAFAILISYRGVILPKLFVGRDFQRIFRRYQRFVIGSYTLAIMFALFALTFVYLPAAKWTSGAQVLGGLSYFVMVPSLTTSRILKRDNEARLSILQFLRERSIGEPDYSWLRRGLRRVERKLPRLGISIPPGGLFLGCSYRIIKGIRVETDLIPISEWIVSPTDTPVSSITRLLLSAGDAQALGISQPETIADKLRKLPWQHIMTLIAVSFGAILGLLTSFIRNLLGLG